MWEWCLTGTHMSILLMTVLEYLFVVYIYIILFVWDVFLFIMWVSQLVCIHVSFLVAVRPRELNVCCRAILEPSSLLHSCRSAKGINLLVAVWPANCYHFSRPKGVMQELAHKHSRFVFICLLFVCLQVCHQPHEFQSIILSLFPLRTDGEHPFIWTELCVCTVSWKWTCHIPDGGSVNYFQDQSDPDFSLTC